MCIVRVCCMVNDNRRLPTCGLSTTICDNLFLPQPRITRIIAIFQKQWKCNIFSVNVWLSKHGPLMAYMCGGFSRFPLFVVSFVSFRFFLFSWYMSLLHFFSSVARTSETTICNVYTQCHISTLLQSFFLLQLFPHYSTVWRIVQCVPIYLHMAHKWISFLSLAFQIKHP